MTGITCIGSSDIYFAVHKNRPDLKAALDRAMAEIENNNPYYAEDLYRKYMSSVNSAVLSDEEMEWLDAHGSIRIAYLKNNLAVSGIDPQTGELIGAIAEYIRFAENCLANRKLEFDPVPYDNLMEEMQGLKNREVDCFVTAANRLNNYYDSKEYYSTYLSKMGKMAFATNRDDTVLMSILNKTLKTMPESLMVGVLTMYSNPARKVTLMDFVKENLTEVLGIFGIIILLLGFMIYRLYLNGRRLTAALEEAKREKNTQIS